MESFDRLKRQKQEMELKINEKALDEASGKLRKLRLTNVSGRKEYPVETVKSVLRRGL